jgi:hypothetical protein
MAEQAEGGADRVRALVQTVAATCLGELADAGVVPRPEGVLQAWAGWSVLVLTFPTPAGEGEPGLTDCDKDCLALLARADEPLSAARVRRDLERRGIGIWAEVTVKRALAKLKGRGLVCNSRRSRRGYYLPENLPLFRSRYRL